MAKTRIVSWEKKKQRNGYYFVLPFIIGSLLFIIIPVFSSLTYSFSTLVVNTDGYSLDFVGISNYYNLFAVDPTYRKVLLNSVGEMLINVPITVVFSFFIASILNQKFMCRGIVRGVFFLPVILASGIYIRLSASDTVTNSMSQSVQGSEADGIMTAFVNMLSELNLDSGVIDFLVMAVGRIGTIVAMSAIPIVIFLAGFQSISPSVFEASYMEGASKWQVFWKISFPMVSSLILVCVVYTIIDSFTSSANTMINLIHQTAFLDFKFGLGSAMVWIYMFVIFIIIGISYAVINKHVFYYD